MLVPIPSKVGKALKRKYSKKPKRSYRKKRTNNIKDWGSISCKRSVVAPNGGPFQSNTMYKFLNIQLFDFERAANMAENFQHYRMKSVALTFKPLYDTFVAGVGSTSSKPNLYYMIDKSGSIPTNVNLEGLKQMGARPTQLDEKNLVRSWKPSVLEATMTAAGSGPSPASVYPSKYRISPWLSTNADVVDAGWSPSEVDHLGIYFYVDQLVNLQQAYAYTIEIEVQFEFKKPLDVGNTGAIQALPVRLATRNQSADGVVGGGDGE